LVNPLDTFTGQKSSVENPVDFPAFFALEANAGKNTTSTGILQQKKKGIPTDGEIQRNQLGKGAT
jgi:hypothetical protein